MAGCKQLGNDCFKVGKIEEAVVYYTQAIDLSGDAPTKVWRLTHGDIFFCGGFFGWGYFSFDRVFF